MLRHSLKFRCFGDLFDHIESIADGTLNPYEVKISVDAVDLDPSYLGSQLVIAYAKFNPPVMENHVDI
jgi:hypothetical protein